MKIDIFNGDADGICALLQLRLFKPCVTQLVTGVKRHINLLSNVNAQQGDQITVLDISLAKNHQDVLRLLAKEVEIFYVDHHFVTDIPQHPKLTALINTDSNTCTSLLMNEHLNGAFYQWAVVGAFGDNMSLSTIKSTQGFCLNDRELASLKTLGICINYNAYGRTLDDLHIAPDTLYQQLLASSSPFEFMDKNPSLYQQLITHYEDDMARAEKISAQYADEAVALYEFPDAPWSRRVNGVFANQLANQFPQRAHAILSVDTPNKCYQISVRAPLNNKEGADELCRSFPNGGGRKSAAGINNLNEAELPLFIQRFKQKYQS
jgi:single-stranded DNA-specific DHH superfamily exonuclease